jgi:hypothetical protein
LNPTPASHDTPTIRLPDEGRDIRLCDEHQRRVGVLQHAVDHDVVAGEERGGGHWGMAIRTTAPGIVLGALEVRARSTGSVRRLL